MVSLPRQPKMLRHMRSQPSKRPRNPLPAQPGPSSGGRSPLPLAVAIAISLLAVLLVRQLRGATMTSVAR